MRVKNGIVRVLNQDFTGHISRNTQYLQWEAPKPLSLRVISPLRRLCSSRTGRCLSLRSVGLVSHETRLIVISGVTPFSVSTVVGSTTITVIIIDTTSILDC